GERPTRRTSKQLNHVRAAEASAKKTFLADFVSPHIGTLSFRPYWSPDCPETLYSWPSHQPPHLPDRLHDKPSTCLPMERRSRQPSQAIYILQRTRSFCLRPVCKATC